jgi:hypothetical protein
MTNKPDKPRDPTDTSHPQYNPTEDPTHPFYEGEKTEGEPKGYPSDQETYKVGPGFPPNEHKWKPGCPSPFPSGRPKKIPSMKPDVKKIFEDALNENVEITKADKKIRLTKLALGFQHFATQFAKGDRYARRDVFTYAALLGVDLKGKEVIAEALENNHKAIVDAYLQRHQKSSQEAASDDHVKAPPDLIDDDVNKPEPDETPADPPQPGISAKKQDEPVLDDDGRPLPVSDIRSVREMARRRLAQQRKDQGES